jgi:hypothetical protein
VTTLHIAPDLHVTPTPSYSSTPKSQDNRPEISSARTGDEPQRTASSPFPTVVISQSTPKPTPPDTPARCLSPTTFQALTPLHALSLTHRLSPPSSTVSSHTQQQQSNSINTSPSVKSHHTAPSVPSSSTVSSYRGMSETATATRMPGEQSFSNKFHSNAIPEPPAQPLIPETETTGNVTGNATGDGSAKHASDSPLPAIAAASRNMPANWLPISTQSGQGPSHPRMFFLQRDSNSFSPESNSRSHSHSRSPASPSQAHRNNSRSSDTRSPSRSRSSDSRSGNAVKVSSASG